jgi:hypothetical protein
MPSICEIGSWITGAHLLLWVVGLWYAVRAVFKSFLAEELRFWVETHPQGDIGRLAMLMDEMQRGRMDSHPPEKNLPTKRVKLSVVEYSHHKKEIEKLRRTTLLYRAVVWLLSCSFCQAGEAALVAVLLSRGWLGWEETVGTVLLYAGLVVVLDRVVGGSLTPAKKGCGA